MDADDFEIAAVSDRSARDELEEMLVEFHEWMVEHGPPSYSLEAELAEDLETLREKPESWAWIARLEGRPAGCILLYGETDELAEFRRLWVHPLDRGMGIGRALTRRVVRVAHSEGYETLGLATPPWADAAHELYESLGFERTGPYPGTRLPEQYHASAIFMQIGLRANA